MKTTYTYLVQLNCKGIKMGKVKFNADNEESEMEAFEKQMEAKYARNEMDLVVTMFR